ncbi:MAG: alpha/beta hydrolase [Gammaproteobacteria bacterium]|nr:alpha/beta hydrolase [Gammaproteobacteria bacterium]MDH3362514.1 alpha/beta hydrolase [Gammaproteobacteria bacterium]MDH3480077.1 alpha/beta hydrolase [Gammaproteobacteria bacterium]
MLRFILVVVTCYALLVAVVYFMQGRMLYLPDLPGRTLTLSPADVGMDYHDVFIKTVDGVMLHGWFVGEQSSRVVLFFHGNAGNISHRLDSIRQFRDLGLAVFIIDYRGYGQSEGRSTERGLYRDADAAWRYLTEDRGIAAANIIVFGRSLGASVASRLAGQHQPLALIVESSFTSVPDIAQDLYPWLPARWLSRLRHATRDYIQNVYCPVLVVHSRDDEIIPFHHGEAIFASANEPRTLLEIRGTHNDGFLRDERTYMEGLRMFLTEISAPPLIAVDPD